MSAGGGGDNPGIGIDSQGKPVIDPTKNVLDLVDSAIRRQDDLREAESRHIALVSELRALHAAELRKAETARIDAIRAVDVSAVNRAAEVSAQQASTLAVQVATSAETLRTQVATAAQQAQVALSAALEPIIKDIADLRRVQYEQVGQKAQVVERQASAGGIGQWLSLAIAAVSLLVALYVLTHK